MAARKKKRVITWREQVLMLGGFIASVVFLPSTILLFFGMLPTVVAALIQRGGSGRALSVGVMNFAGCFPFLLQLWTSQNNIEQSISMLFDPLTIIVMYCAAGVGYLIDWGVSGVVGTLVVQQSKLRMDRIKEEQADLVEQWGIEVTGDVPVDWRGFPLDDEVAEGKAK